MASPVSDREPVLDPAPPGGPSAERSADAQERPLPAPVLVAVVLVLTVLLSVWGAFLVPFRVHGVVVPLWLLPLAAMLTLAHVAARRVGLWGALAPGLLWLGLTWLVFGTPRPEGDLVVPATPAGYAYLFGGFVPWLVVVGLASSRGRTPGAADPPSPARAARR